MPDTSKQKSRRGYHWLFIITEDIREYVKDNGKESYAKPVKETYPKYCVSNITIDS